MNFCLLLKIWVKILIQNIDNNLSDKYSGKILDHTKESATDALKLISKNLVECIRLIVKSNLKVHC